MKPEKIKELFGVLKAMRKERDKQKKLDYDRYLELAYFIDGINYTIKKLNIKEPKQD